MPDTRNLYQKIAQVSKAVGQVEATSKNQYGKEAIGIGDAENAVRDALADAGIVTIWSNPEIADIGQGKLWQATLHVVVVNADNPAERVEADWLDVGGNAAAACSFARKGFYKALLHMAVNEDEQHGTFETSPQHHRYRSQPNAALRPAGRTATVKQIDFARTLMDGLGIPEPPGWEQFDRTVIARWIDQMTAGDRGIVNPATGRTVIAPSTDAPSTLDRIDTLCAAISDITNTDAGKVLQTIQARAGITSWAHATDAQMETALAKAEDAFGNAQRQVS